MLITIDTTKIEKKIYECFQTISITHKYKLLSNHFSRIKNFNLIVRVRILLMGDHIPNNSRIVPIDLEITVFVITKIQNLFGIRKAKKKTE